MHLTLCCTLAVSSLVSHLPSLSVVSKGEKTKGGGKKAKYEKKNKKANTLEAAGSVLISEVNPLNSLQQAFDTF